MTQWRKNESRENGEVRLYPKIDLNASRRAAQDAIAEMRKNRLKYGRPTTSGGKPTRTDKRCR